MEIDIIAFGQITDITGKSTWKLSGIKDTDELKSKLSEEFSELNSVKYSIAVNKILIQENTQLHQNDIVALLPPFSGG